MLEKRECRWTTLCSRKGADRAGREDPKNVCCSFGGSHTAVQIGYARVVSYKSAVILYMGELGAQARMPKFHGDAMPCPATGRRLWWHGYAGIVMILKW